MDFGLPAVLVISGFTLAVAGALLLLSWSPPQPYSPRSSSGTGTRDGLPSIPSALVTSLQPRLAFANWSSAVRPYLGHNPVACALVSILYVLLVIQAATGLVLAGTDVYYPPFGHWITSWIAAPGVDPVTIAPYNKTGIDPAAWDAMRSFRAVILRIHIGISMRLSLLLPSTLLASS